MKVEYNSPVILTYAIICTLVLVADAVVGGNLMPWFTVPGSLEGQGARGAFLLFSHVIGHGNAAHLFGNFTMILLIGPIVEEKYGSLLLLTMIAFTALFTGALNVLLFSTGLLGASGIVFMLILLASITNVRNGRVPLTFILVVVLFLGAEIAQLMQDDNVSQVTHILGGLCGSLFGFGIQRLKGDTNEPEQPATPASRKPDGAA